jgi:hypothetical protein
VPISVGTINKAAKKNPLDESGPQIVLTGTEMYNNEILQFCQQDAEEVFGCLRTLVPLKPELRPLLRFPGSFETKEELLSYVESRRVIPTAVSSVPSGVVTRDMSNRQYGTRYGSSGNLVSIVNTGRTMPVYFNGTSRGSIEGLSPSAGARMRTYLRSCSSEYKEMVTLTYPKEFPSDGREVKEHLRRFNQEVRREIKRSYGSDCLELHSIFWFLEFQDRGAPHFHLFLTKSPCRVWVADTWARIVGSNDVNHRKAGTRTEYLRTGRGGSISYACKYAAKQCQKTVPDEYLNVGRMWGINGVRKTVSAATIVPMRCAGKENVDSSVRTLKKALGRMIEGGCAKVILQEPDVVLITITDSINQAIIRTLIKRISQACYGDKYDNFVDCELENGS